MKRDLPKKHEQLSDWLNQKIISGEYLVGDKIPSESELAEQFNISVNGNYFSINIGN